MSTRPALDPRSTRSGRGPFPVAVAVAGLLLSGLAGPRAAGAADAHGPVSLERFERAFAQVAAGRGIAAPIVPRGCAAEPSASCTYAVGTTVTVVAKARSRDRDIDDLLVDIEPGGRGPTVAETVDILFELLEPTLDDPGRLELRTRLTAGLLATDREAEVESGMRRYGLFKDGAKRVSLYMVAAAGGARMVMRDRPVAR